jgi:hypothetical protein
MSTARFEYLELLRPLQRRIKNQRAEIRRLQAYELWYAKYVYGKQAPETLHVPALLPQCSAQWRRLLVDELTSPK